MGIKAFLEAGNIPEAERAFAGNERKIPLLIRKAMIQRLFMSTMRMHDKPGSDRETLRGAFELLADRTVYSCVAEDGDDSRLEAAVAGWDLLSRDPALLALRKVRDFEVAHTIPSKAGERRPLMLEFFRVVDKTNTSKNRLVAGDAGAGRA